MPVKGVRVRLPPSAPGESIADMEIQEHIKDDGQTVEITLVIPPEEYMDRALKELKKIKKQLRIPGFRPGHVPDALAKRLVGERMLHDIFMHIVNEQLREALKERRLAGDPVLGGYDVQGIRWEDAQPGRISFIIGLMPEVTLPEKLDPPVSYPQVEVDDDYLNQYIERQRRRYGSLEPVEDPTEAEFVRAYLIEEGREPIEFVLPLNYLKPEKESALREAGTETTVSLNLTSDLAVEPQKFWELVYTYVPQERQAELTEWMRSPEVQMQIKQYERLKPAELDENFFTQVLHVGYMDGVEDEQTFREALRKQLQEELQELVPHKVMTEVIDRLRREVEVPVPEEYFKALVNQEAIEKNLQLSEEEKQVEVDRKKDQFIVRVLFDALLRHFGVRLMPEEVEQAYAEYLKKHMTGDMIQDDERLRQLAHYLLEQDVQRRARWEERMVLQRLMDKMLEAGWLTPQPITATEFVNR